MWSSHATKRPVPYTGLHARQPHRAALIHTNGGGTDKGSLYGWWTAGARGQRGPDNRHVGAQFQVMLTGHAEQYVDSSLVVYHAYDASEWAFAIEVEDENHPERPMTDAQLATIVAILREHRVPGRLLTSTSPADGVGWHEQFPQWNKTGHHCPGGIREQQIRNEIIPALAHRVPRPVLNPHRTPDYAHHVINCSTRGAVAHGEPVAWAQWAMRIADDGICGPKTRAALAAYQHRHGLTADLLIGANTGRYLQKEHR